MPNHKIDSIKTIFHSRLTTLEHLLKSAQTYFSGSELFLQKRINEFLMPNFYFHLVTAYNILRMAGVPIGKQDYMMHLVPFVKKA